MANKVHSERDEEENEKVDDLEEEGFDKEEKDT